jgi:hypothetical protein
MDWMLGVPRTLARSGVENRQKTYLEKRGNSTI